MEPRHFDEHITLTVFQEEADVYLHMALRMLRVIREGNERGEDTAIIVPVGPTGHYPVLARLVNELRVPLHRVHFFNMDEYMLDPHTIVSYDDPLSFHASMDRWFYSRVDSDLVMPKANRHFPQPGDERAYDEALASFGGAKLCVGGLGINGHLAFNEPPEPDAPMTAEAFGALGTRVLPISRETRAVNAIGYKRGDIEAMPKYCISVGMKQILLSKQVLVAFSRAWQFGIARRVLTGPVTASAPASLLQKHPDVEYVSPEAIAQGL